MSVDDDLRAHAEKLKELTDTKKNLAELVKATNAAIESTSESMLAIMDSKEMTQVRFEGLGLFFVQGSTFPKVEGKEQFHEWLKANGQGDLIKEEVHSQTLRAFVKNLLEEGKALPPGVTPGHTVREVRVRAS
jgi:hypothetical protein